MTLRKSLIAALILAGTIAMPATAAVSVSIGINLPTYPVLQRVPGYPVYYAPSLNSNYFFYDGLYWVYQGDAWYSSPWYNGPWEGMDRYEVPAYILRVPVRYYRSAPVHFRGYRADAPPRWGDHWGQSWQQSRSGWDRWERSSAPAPAPLPVYQRQYSGTRYPDRSQQVTIQTQSYNYQPREAVVQQRYEQHRSPSVAQAPRAQGHPPGNAKGWEGGSQPPGNAKGWDGGSQPPGQARRDDRDDNRGQGGGKESKENHGQGKENKENKENKGKGKD